ncbi:glutathione S-transferase [Tolypothrix campylonemoides VB511288]|nr:glutathione S-transferase [Tolypothrix campylonemoides VB511288]
MIQLYDTKLSGNCYKVRLMLSLLGLEYKCVPIALNKGEHKTEEFLKLNPLGQLPVLRDGDVVIRDAQAILVYLARRYGSEEWLPTQAEPMSRVMQWLSVAANEIQHGVAAVRKHFLLNAEIDLEQAQKKAHQTLQILDKHLSKRLWLECVDAERLAARHHPTIADVACFPYVALAPDGKISLEPYPHVVGWIERIKQLPGYVDMSGV